MIIKIPLTGKVLDYHPGENRISGDPNDPVRNIPINFGMVRMSLIEIDLENDVGIWKVTALDKVAIPVLDGSGNQKFDDDGNPLSSGTRNATSQEKQARLDFAEAKVKNKTKDQLYAETGSPKLKKLKKHVDDYKKFKADKAGVA